MRTHGESHGESMVGRPDPTLSECLAALAAESTPVNALCNGLPLNVLFSG